MREIKFRAWWSNIGEMEYFDTVAFLNFEDGTLIYQKHPEEETCTDEISDGFELMQYTGLKDKNGKEIYEGDIVKKVEAIPFIDTSDIVGVVKFLDGSFLLEYERWGEKIGCYLFSETDEHEILGNIHENAELLKK